MMPGSQPIHKVEVSVLERVCSNLIGNVLSIEHFAPLMIRGGGGRIIYVSSAAAVQSNAGLQWRSVDETRENERHSRGDCADQRCLHG